MRRIAYLALIAGATSGNAMAQSAGSIMTSVGGAWLDFGGSSTTALQSSSAAGTFTSPGTGGQVHNTFTGELVMGYFITDNISVELAAGVPPKLKLYTQGTAAPLGAGGPTLDLDDLKPIESARAWPPVLFLKYYFGSAQSKLRPFGGVGVNYTWYSHIE